MTALVQSCLLLIACSSSTLTSKTRLYATAHHYLLRFVVVSEITKEFMEIITPPPGSLVTGSMQFHSVA